MSGFNKKRTISDDFFIAVQRGFIPGATAIIQAGENLSVPVSGEDIWNNPDNVSIYPSPTAAVILNIDSTSVNDTLLGTGANTMEVFGLDDLFNFQNEIVNLNGLTTVNTTNQYRSIFLMIIRSAGILGENDGTIIARNQSNGDALAAINPSDNESLMTMFTIPSNKTGLLIRVWLGSGESNRAPRISLKIKPFGQVFQTKIRISASAGHVDHQFKIPLILTEKSDIKIFGQAATGSLSLVSGYDLILLDN